jgi:hypothetical protein
MAVTARSVPRRYLVVAMMSLGAAVIAFLLAFRILTGLAYDYLEGVLLALGVSGNVLILRSMAKARRLVHG